MRYSIGENGCSQILKKGGGGVEFLAGRKRRKGGKKGRGYVEGNIHKSEITNKNNRNIKLLMKKNYGATSFSRNGISSNRRFAEMQFCRIVILPDKKFPKVI